MKKIREINKEIFKTNLLKTNSELVDTNEIGEDRFKFKIELLKDSKKTLDMQGDIMRLVLLSEKNVGNRLLNLDQAVTLMTSMAPFVPSGIEVSFLEMVDEVFIFKLETTGRVTKPSLLKYAEIGHPPFKALNS